MTAFFTENAQTEVPVAGIINGYFVSRRIDRLVVDDEKKVVRILDYKTDVDKTKYREKYIIQLGEYEKLMHQIYPEYKTKSENISPNNDARIEPITKLIKVMKAIASRRVIQLVSTIDKSDSQDDETLYANMRFGDSITVKRLVLHEMKYPSCRKHAIEYQNINVKILLPKGEFVFSTRCCPICKKLYVKKKNFQGVKDLLDRKKVDYAWIPEDE